jgi:hypothetical protein
MDAGAGYELNTKQILGGDDPRRIAGPDRFHMALHSGDALMPMETPIAKVRGLGPPGEGAIIGGSSG